MLMRSILRRPNPRTVIMPEQTSALALRVRCLTVCLHHVTPLSRLNSSSAANRMVRCRLYVVSDTIDVYSGAGIDAGQTLLCQT